MAGNVCCCVSPAFEEKGVVLGAGDFRAVFLTRYASKILDFIIFSS